jgi:hypothetical protein
MNLENAAGPRSREFIQVSALGAARVAQLTGVYCLTVFRMFESTTVRQLLGVPPVQLQRREYAHSPLVLFVLR